MKIERLIKNRYLYIFSVALVVFNVLPESVLAQNASLSIFPQRGSFTAGNYFDVSIYLNTGDNNVNAVQVDLQFDPEKLQVISPTKGLSVVGEWIFPPSFSNTQGTVSLLGGFLFEGINTSEGLVTTVVFEALSEGETEISFLNSCKVLIGKDEGKNILSSVNKGIYNILPSPFKGPQIFSETHPDQNRWCKNNSPTFNWGRTEENETYSYVLNDDPYGEPDNEIDSFSSSVSFEDVEDGTLYFHLKGKRGQIWGGTSHFKVNIDKNSPLDFELYLESFTFVPGNNLLIYFDTDDALSGIDNYKSRISNVTDSENKIISGWIRQESPYRFSTDKRGNYMLEIRAFDRAGNFKEGKMELRVINPFFIVTSRGVQVKVIFIFWWQIYLLLAAVISGIGFLVFGFVRQKREDVRVRLQKEIKEAEKEIDDVKKAEEKLRKIRIMEEKAGREWKRLQKDLEQTSDKDSN